MKIVIIVIVNILAMYNSLAFSSSAVKTGKKSISLPVEVISYFALDNQGGYNFKNNKPYHVKKERYTLNKVLTTQDTALLVIDPWVNMPDAKLNSSNKIIINKYVIPLVIKASKQGFPVYVFTQDCKRMLSNYSCSVPQKFLSLQHDYPGIKIYYWDDYNKPGKAARLFTKSGIHNLIYTGFSSNMCILNRPAGMVAMKLQGFSNYFIPEASSAIETQSTKKDKEIHQAMQIIIAQSLGGIIHYNQMVQALEKSSN